MKFENQQSLWDFACALYANPEVKTRCLELQGLYAGNVDIVLWLCWLDRMAIQLNPSALGEALQIIGGSHQQLLNGLRGLRRLVKEIDVDAELKPLLRSHLMEAELAIEKFLLVQLQKITREQMLGAKGGVRLSLAHYFYSLALPQADAEAEHLLIFSRNLLLENS